MTAHTIERHAVTHPLDLIHNAHVKLELLSSLICHEETELIGMADSVRTGLHLMFRDIIEELELVHEKLYCKTGGVL